MRLAVFRRAAERTVFLRERLTAVDMLKLSAGVIARSNKNEADSVNRIRLGGARGFSAGYSI